MDTLRFSLYQVVQADFLVRGREVSFHSGYRHLCRKRVGDREVLKCKNLLREVPKEGVCIRDRDHGCAPQRKEFLCLAGHVTRVGGPICPKTMCGASLNS